MQAACLARCNGATVEAVAAPAPGVDTFRSHVAAVTAAADRHLIAAYSRKQFLQTGAGSLLQVCVVSRAHAYHCLDAAARVGGGHVDDTTACKLLGMAARGGKQGHDHSRLHTVQCSACATEPSAWRCHRISLLCIRFRRWPLQPHRRVPCRAGPGADPGACDANSVPHIPCMSMVHQASRMLALPLSRVALLLMRAASACRVHAAIHSLLSASATSQGCTIRRTPRASSTRPTGCRCRSCTRPCSTASTR